MQHLIFYYRICEQRRLKQACVSAQSLHGLLNSHLNNMDVNVGLEQQIASSGKIHVAVKIT